MSPAERVQAALTEIARRRVVSRAATPGPWTSDETSGVNDLHFGHVTMPVLKGPNTYGPSLADTRHMADNHPSHVLAVLDVHAQILTAADEWLLRRLDQPGFFTDLVRAVLNLYCPETTDA